MVRTRKKTGALQYNDFENGAREFVDQKRKIEVTHVNLCRAKLIGWNNPLRQWNR